MNNNVLVKVEGKNVNNYLKWLIKNKINIINLNILNHNELNIIIDYKDFNKLHEYSKTYKITIIKKYGKAKIIATIKENIIILICLILSIIYLYFLSSYIFNVDIIYNDHEIVTLINKELTKYGIQKYHKKKKHSNLEQIKKQILNDNKEILEWLEIEESGTKYIVRLVERKQEKITKEHEYQSIVANKTAIITTIKAYSGEKVKKVNEYVKKNDVIISGIMIKPDNTEIYTQAKGSVIGEVWYKVNIEYPLYYQEESLTGKNKTVMTLYLFNKEFFLFPYKKYKNFKRESKTIAESHILPIKIAKEKLYEVTIKEDIYTSEEAITRALDEAKNKLLSANKKIIEINNAHIISKENMNSKIKLNIFISVLEDITKIIPITPENN